MADIKTNQTYAPMINAAKLFGKTISRRQPIDTSRFSGVSSAVKNSGPIIDRLKSLGTMTTPYGGSTNYEGTHPGIDIANKSGTPIPSMTAGTVVEAKTGQGWTPNKPSFGNYIVVKTPDNKYVRYSHLQDAFVPVGTQVAQGQEIGTIGKTGSTYSRYGAAGDPSHLDLRIWEAYQGAKKYLNPLEYLSNV